MKIMMMSLNKLKPYDNNPRRNDAAVQAVMASLKEFGPRQPIVVDKDMVIVAGHTRYRAALQMGMAIFPVHVADNLTPEQIKAYRLADNKVGEVSEWDDDKLMMELMQLAAQDYDMAQFGFSELDLQETEAATKKDERWLEDYTVLPAPKPAWILLAVPEDTGAVLIADIRKKYPKIKAHATFEAPNN